MRQPTLTDTKFSPEPEAIPNNLRDIADDFRRTVKWASEQMEFDGYHADDRRAFEEEAERWAWAAKRVEALADEMEAHFMAHPRTPVTV